MERGKSSEGEDSNNKKNSSEDKDDSLTDFKSPKAETAGQGVKSKLKIVTEQRTKKTNTKAKPPPRTKKKLSGDTGRQSKVVKGQTSIESSFFKTSDDGKRTGHTCPLCMRYFEDVYSGTAHTKNCAAKNKVSTTKLLAAVALQERQTDERLALGLPSGPVARSKDKTPRRNRRAISNNDPDLQLAVALSKSLQDNRDEEELEAAFLLAAEHSGDDQLPTLSSGERRQTLKNFGFLSNKPVSEAPTRTRRKKHLGPTVLQTRTQESRDRLLTERIAEILMGNEAITQVRQHRIPDDVISAKKVPVVLKSRMLKEIHRTTKRLWDSAELSRNVTNFYVDDLGAVLLPVIDKQKDSGTTCETILDDEATSSDGTLRVPSENHREENNEEIEKMLSSPENRMEETDNSDENPKSINVTDRQYRNNLPADWANTLNLSSMSDVLVLVEKNHIWAHKLVFHVRCSDILLDCEPMSDDKFPHVKEKICWDDVDYLSALAFLEFVYSGLIVKNEHIFRDDRTAGMVRNLARKYRLKILFEYMRKRKSEIDRRSDEMEGRKSGLRSPIVIEVNQRNPEDQHVEESVITISSGNLQSAGSPPAGKSSDVDLTKIAISEQIVHDDAEANMETESAEANIETESAEANIETESADNISIASTYKYCTSPDLFDDTTEGPTEDTPSSPEITEPNARASTNENPNLDALAQLIADDTSISSTASTYVMEKQPEESPSEERTAELLEEEKMKKSALVQRAEEFSSLPQIHGETPRRSVSYFANEEINNRSRSQRLPERAKSNLSIFIEKVQKINAKSTLDSYTEEESLGEPYDRGRLRNPFNVNNESNRSAMEDDARESNKKGALSALEEQLLLQPGSDDFSIDLTQADESESINESASIVQSDQESSIFDNSANTDDENISMYSKYKKTHEHNNSINTYRSLLRKSLEASAATTEDDTGSSYKKSIKDDAIDLTQESDSETESSPPSNIGRSRKRISNIRPLISDSNDSLVSEGRVDNSVKSSTLGNPDNFTKSKDASAMENFDDLEFSIPATGSAVENFDDVEFSIPATKSAMDEDKNLNTSIEYPDFNPRKADTEIFTQSANRGTPSPMRSDISSKSLRRRLRILERQDNETSVADYSGKDKNGSCGSEIPKNAQSLSESSKFPELDVFEVDEDLFAESFGSPQPSPRKSLSTASPTKSGSSDRKRKSHEIEGKTSDNGSSKDDEKIAAKSRRNSPHYSDYDALDNCIFDRSYQDTGGSPRKSWSPLPPALLLNYEETINDDSVAHKKIRVPSPIFISSSPDSDIDNEKLVAESRNSNKENSFVAAANIAVPLTLRKKSLSPSNPEEPLSPKPGPSRRRFSPDRSKVSKNSRKNSMVRWNSMPTTSSSTQGHLKRTRTPTKSSRQILSQGVAPRINYDAMNTPELKRELEKYGIKPQKSHRARQLLTHIYNELHPEGQTASSDIASSDDEEPPPKKIGTCNNQISEDSDSESASSGDSVIPEEMEFSDPEAGGADISNKSSIKQAFTALINDDKELHNKLLTYEPLRLDLLILLLKARNFKCKVNDLMDFLDEECITFQVPDQARRRKNPKPRGKKTATTGTRKPNSQKS